MKNFQVKNFDQWASFVFEGNTNMETLSGTYFFDKGDADHRSLFECLIEDSTVNEALNSVDFDFNKMDAWLNEGIVLSLEAGNDEPLNEVFGFVQKAIDGAMDSADKLINKGIELGGKLYTSVKEFGAKIKDTIKAVYEKVKKFLDIMWENAKDKGTKVLTKVKETFKKDENAVSELAELLSGEATESELKAASEDIKGAVKKVSGVTYNLDPAKAVEPLKKSAEELEDAKEEEVEELVVGALGESEVNDLMISIKGALLEGYTIDEILDFAQNDSLPVDESEEGHKKKSLLGWLVEAIGFAMSPFSKLYENVIRMGSNAVMRTVSAISRGGFDKAFKYTIMGSIASLVYHISHGLTEIGNHLAHSTHESVVNEEAKALNFKDVKEQLFTWENTEKLLVAGLGAIFTKAIKAFFPMVGLILEIVITAIAAIELIAAVCELGEMKEKAFCSVVLKVEHKFL